jgi:hypothetical protein
MKIAVMLFLTASYLVSLRAQDLPIPVLEYKGSGDNGSHITQYNFAISNYAAYPGELFLPAPDLPPCGRNRNSSQTWIEIFDHTGNYVYGFCGLKDSSDLQKLWFAIPEGKQAPKWIRVVVNDRRTGRTAEGRLDIPTR